MTAIWGIGARTADAPRRARHRHRRGPRPRRPRGAGAPLRPGDRAAPAHPRPRRRRLADRRRAAGRQVAQQGGDVHAATSPDADAIAAHVEPAGRDGDGEVVAEGRRVTHVAVKVRTATFFTRTKIASCRRPDHRSRRGRARRRWSCSPASARSGRCACSACAWCWRRRPPTDRRRVSAPPPGRRAGRAGSSA